mmetsp:Transcript_879/g.1659  ORF Transcript_879/g.1659 Transcript_879/m.1659 type:complete len:500 (+) Transcript_879:887-2386(+)
MRLEARAEHELALLRAERRRARLVAAAHREQQHTAVAPARAARHLRRLVGPRQPRLNLCQPGHRVLSQITEPFLNEQQQHRLVDADSLVAASDVDAPRLAKLGEQRLMQVERFWYAHISALLLLHQYLPAVAPADDLAQPRREHLQLLAVHLGQCVRGLGAAVAAVVVEQVADHRHRGANGALDQVVEPAVCGAIFSVGASLRLLSLALELGLPRLVLAPQHAQVPLLLAEGVARDAEQLADEEREHEDQHRDRVVRAAAGALAARAGLARIEQARHVLGVRGHLGGHLGGHVVREVGSRVIIYPGKLRQWQLWREEGQLLQPAADVQSGGRQSAAARGERVGRRHGGEVELHWQHEQQARPADDAADAGGALRKPRVGEEVAKAEHGRGEHPQPAKDERSAQLVAVLRAQHRADDENREEEEADQDAAVARVSVDGGHGGAEEHARVAKREVRRLALPKDIGHVARLQLRAAEGDADARTLGPQKGAAELSRRLACLN